MGEAICSICCIGAFGRFWVLCIYLYIRAVLESFFKRRLLLLAGNRIVYIRQLRHLSRLDKHATRSAGMCRGNQETIQAEAGQPGSAANRSALEHQASGQTPRRQEKRLHAVALRGPGCCVLRKMEEYVAS